MPLSNDAPRLPKLPFIIGDIVLLVAAWLTYQKSSLPLGTAPLIAIVVCVALGAVLFAIPFLADYAQTDREALADRQRSLEALARTTASAAEQISIAAAGLHEIATLTQKNLKAAEHLPQRLQEKISEFNQRLNEAAATENEALQQEVNTLRAAEAERLESAADKLARSTTALTKLDAAVQQHLAALATTAATLPALTAGLTAALAAARSAPPAPTAPADSTAATPPPADPPSAPAGETGAATLPPKRKRPKPATGEPETAAEPSPPGTVSAPALPPPPEEPPPAPPTSSGNTNPMLELGLSDDTPLSSTGGYATQLSNPPMPFGVPPPAPVAELREPAAPAESALSSDGFTRLTATAYIGIGNKLFLRGDGPGLSPDKGVPLQFISIGKWRWETADATAAVTVRLYKNDQQECAELGALTLQPGHQHEVTANF